MVAAAEGIGGALIAWQDQRLGSSVYARRLMPSGQFWGWGTNGVEVGPPQESFHPAITRDSSGGAFIAVESWVFGGLNRIFVSHLDSLGMRRPGWTQYGTEVMADTMSSQSNPTTTALSATAGRAGGVYVTAVDQRSVCQTCRSGWDIWSVAMASQDTVLWGAPVSHV